MASATGTPLLAVLPSPLLGPSVWAPAAAALALRGWSVTTCVARDPVTPDGVLAALLSQLAEDREVVLVPHSNAGAYVPAIVSRRRVVGVVFVDAVLPPRDGAVPLAPEALVEMLRPLADEAGRLPGWTQWWSPQDVTPLFPDDAARARIESEQPRLPLSYLEGSLPVPAGWDRVPAAYLAFGDTYGPERDDAGARGWPVRTLAGHHLHLLAEPDVVAASIDALLSTLGLLPE